MCNVLFFVLYWLIIKSKIIVPVNRLVTAAKNYSLDDNINKDDFVISSLSITTGDELEILADSLKNIEKKVQKYIFDLNEASRRASTDFLTGLHNREAFYNSVNEFLLKRIPGKLHAFIVLDIDRFKEINDTYGHPVGDEVLKNFAAVLRSQFRNSDDIARMGGDEFTIFCGNIGSRGMVERKAQLIKQVASMIYPAEGAEPITVSIGITILSDKPVDYETLFQRADAALYQSKLRGRNDYTIELL
jgi:diguanylate cyclase (GGDEF)-like protein